MKLKTGHLPSCQMVGLGQSEHASVEEPQSTEVSGEGWEVRRERGETGSLRRYGFRPVNRDCSFVSRPPRPEQSHRNYINFTTVWPIA